MCVKGFGQHLMKDLWLVCGERFCAKMRCLLDLLGLPSGVTSLLLECLRQLRHSQLRQTPMSVPSAGVHLSLCRSECPWSGCSYRLHADRGGQHCADWDPCSALMVIFLFSSLPAETLCPHFLVRESCILHYMFCCSSCAVA